MDPKDLTPDGGATPPAEAKVEPVIPASEEVDPRIKDLVGQENFEQGAQPASKPAEDKKPASEPEKSGEEPKPAAQEPERKEGDEGEGKDGKKPEAGETKPDQGKEPETVPVQGPKVYRSDKRIAQLYRDIKVLEGDESASDINIDEFAQEIAKYPYEQREAKLKELLALKSRLKNPGDKTPFTIPDEELDVIVESRAQDKLHQKQEEDRIEAFNKDIRDTYESHPDLQEDKPEYDKKVAEACAALVSSGKKLSEAYELVTGVKAESEAKVAEIEAKKVEDERRAALSGAISGSDKSSAPKTLSWDEIERISKEDPDKYREMVRKGQIPE